MAGTSVALSGGGHRASLFGLGVLLCLVDTEENRRVTSIASVSGGSITNGYVAKTLSFETTNGAAFRAAVQPLVHTLAVRGTFQSARGFRIVPLIPGIVFAAALAFGPLRHSTSPVVQLGVLALLTAILGYWSVGRGLRTKAGGMYGGLL